MSGERRKITRRILIGVILAACLAAAFFGALSGLTDPKNRKTDSVPYEISSEAQMISDGQDKVPEEKNGTSVSADSLAGGKTGS